MDGVGGSVRLSGRAPLLPVCRPVVGAFAVYAAVASCGVAYSGMPRYSATARAGKRSLRWLLPGVAMSITQASTNLGSSAMRMSSHVRLTLSHFRSSARVRSRGVSVCSCVGARGCFTSPPFICCGRFFRRMWNLLARKRSRGGGGAEQFRDGLVEGLRQQVAGAVFELASPAVTGGDHVADGGAADAVAVDPPGPLGEVLDGQVGRRHGFTDRLAVVQSVHGVPFRGRERRRRG